MRLRQSDTFRPSTRVPAGNPAAYASARPYRRARRLLRGVLRASVALAVLAAVGAGYETVAASGDAVRYPAPGRLVDVDGTRLHIACAGRGRPTVVLDAGLGGTSLDWVLVQSRLAGTTTVCAYDRAGMGWSDPGQAPRAPSHIASELGGLLAKAGVPGPYVLVAHSLAGKSARKFAAANPGDVAGMVLVDTRSERIDAAMTQAGIEGFDAALKRQSVALAIARRLGLVRLVGPRLAGLPTLPPHMVEEMLVLQTEPKSLDATEAEGLARSADDAALAGGTLGAIPLVVIAAGDSNANIPGWAEAQAGLAALSAKGRLIVAEGSSHAVQIDQPRTVIAAVLSVLEAARAGH